MTDLAKKFDDAMNDYGWGWTSVVTIDGNDYIITWEQDGTDDEWDDYSSPREAVAKFEYEGQTRYIKKHGRYISHDGMYWDGDCYEVFPREEVRSRFVKADEIVSEGQRFLYPSEVKEALLSHDAVDDYWGEVSWAAKSGALTELEIDGVKYPFTFIEEGGEGEWSYETSLIFQVGNQTFRKTGHYQSHYGNDWDGPLTEVHQVQKTITVWDNK